MEREDLGRRDRPREVVALPLRATAIGEPYPLSLGLDALGERDHPQVLRERIIADTMLAASRSVSTSRMKERSIFSTSNGMC